MNIDNNDDPLIIDEYEGDALNANQDSDFFC